jgi:hypothetical protein
MQQYALVTGDLSGLDAGIDHFNPADVPPGLVRNSNFRGLKRTKSGQDCAKFGSEVEVE